MMSKKEFYIVYIYFEKVMFNLSIVDYKFIKDSIMLKYKKSVQNSTEI